MCVYTHTCMCMHYMKVIYVFILGYIMTFFLFSDSILRKLRNHLGMEKSIKIFLFFYYTSALSDLDW